MWMRNFVVVVVIISVVVVVVAPSSKAPISMFLLDQPSFCNNRSRLNENILRPDDLYIFKGDGSLSSWKGELYTIFVFKIHPIIWT